MAVSSEMESADFVASLARGLAVIRAFGHDAHEMTLTEVARRTGLTRATARRFLHTLARLGYAASADGKHFRLTAKVLDLLKRAGGVTAKELMKATGWQAHTVRGFISGTLGKKMGLTVASTKNDSGERTYSVTR